MRRRRDASLIYMLNVWLLLRHFAGTDSIQCFTCKTTAANEIHANIRCLETAFLENCDDFYHYYDVVESDKRMLEYDYGGYEMQDVETTSATPERPNNDSGGSRRKVDPSRPKRSAKLSKTKRDYADDEADAVQTTLAIRAPVRPTTKRAPVRPTTIPPKSKHHCYSTVTRNGWESYTVEKGCKRISYCLRYVAKEPAWSKPWNFCCKRSRCNTKLVRDRPQRVFGVGCRSTTDCIQGYTSRPICSESYKICPRVASSIVKMECRSRRDPSLSSFSKTYLQSSDKRCYCTKGSYPKGPICSGTPQTGVHVVAILLSTIIGSGFFLRK